MTKLLTTVPPRASMALTGQVLEAREYIPDGTTSIDDLWRILRCRRGLVAAVMAVVFGATLCYGLTTPPIYSASSEILVDPRDRQVLASDVNPGGVSPDGGITQVESQTRVIGSSGVLLKAIAATNLTADPSFNGRGSHSWITDWLPGSSGPAEDIEAATLRTLKKHVAIKRADRLLVLEVVVTASQPDTAAKLANAIADAYLEDQASARRDATQTVSSALTAQLADQRARVAAAENAIQTYRTAHRIVTAEGQLVGEQQLSDASKQLVAMRGRAATLKAQVDQLSRLRASDATSEAMQSPVIGKLREQEAVLSQRAGDLDSRLGSRHPSVIAVRSQLANLHGLIAAELNRTILAARGDYERAQADVQALSSEVDRLKADTLAMGQVSVQLRAMERDLDASRAVYATFLTRSQETHDQAGIDSTNIRIISHALPPHDKSWPPLGLLLVGALVSGLGLGSGLALLREYAAPTVLSRLQIERAIGARVIGIMPRRKRRSWHSRDGTAATKRESGVAGLVLRRLFDLGTMSADPNTIRSLLLVSGAADAKVRRLLWGFLGAAGATRGDRVLMVDADFAGGKTKPSADPGLLEILHGECPLDAAVTVPPRGAMAWLGKGRTPRDGQGGRVTTQLLADARNHFDIAVIDGGVAVENLAASPLISAAHEIVLVVQLMRTKQKAVIAAADAAATMGQSISAILLIDS